MTPEEVKLVSPMLLVALFVERVLWLVHKHCNILGVGQ